MTRRAESRREPSRLHRQAAHLLRRLGEALRRGSRAYAELLESAFRGVEPVGRQIVRLHVDTVKRSCGYGTPLFAYRGERPSLDNWACSKGEEGLEAYRREENLVSIDGLRTGLLDEV